MKLVKIEYEVFESEYDYVLSLTNEPKHELDREVRLEFENGEVMYIMWADSPVQFCVKYADSSGYSTEPDKTFSVSTWKIWEPFINTNIDISYIEESNEMIELSNNTNSLFFWAGSSNSGSDTLSISVAKPKSVKAKFFSRIWAKFKDLRGQSPFSNILRLDPVNPVVYAPRLK